jgi:hypothetical protein
MTALATVDLSVQVAVRIGEFVGKSKSKGKRVSKAERQAVKRQARRERWVKELSQPDKSCGRLLAMSKMSMYARLEKSRASSWVDTVKGYESAPLDFFWAWRFLEDHPANTRRFVGKDGPGVSYSSFEQNLDIAVVKVNPVTKCIEPVRRVDKKGKAKVPEFMASGNTETNIWLEWGPFMEVDEFSEDERTYMRYGSSSHDPRCDTGGESFEEAIVNLAHNVYVLYGRRARVEYDERLRGRDRW